jgi:hypothetical protein
MRVEMNESVAQAHQEAVLLSKFEKLARAAGPKVDRTLAIKNEAGEVRIVVLAHSEAEADGVEETLGSMGYHDELVVDYEEEDEHGGLECWVDIESHPDYDCVFSRKEPRLVRTSRPATDS